MWTLIRACTVCPIASTSRQLQEFVQGTRYPCSISYYFIQIRQLLWFPVCFPASSPFWKRIYCKREEFAPKGSKFFLFRIDLFSEGKKKTYWQSCISLENVSIPFKDFSIGPDKKLYLEVFFLFLHKTYVVGTHLKHLDEALLMSTQNICFVEK